jgi:hypothetical protein
MQKHPEIKRFVRETLGCSCPEEVFEKIECQNEIEGIPGSRIIVGNRLLIYIIPVDGQSGIRSVIEAALERGVTERDNKGFNRLRLVLTTSRPDELRSLAEHGFEDSGYADSKTHLHVVNEADITGFR